MNNELYHHGVLGMKWGVRRYQSYDTVPRESGKRGKELGEAKKSKPMSRGKALRSAKKAGNKSYKALDQYEKRAIKFEKLQSKVQLSNDPEKTGKRLQKKGEKLANKMVKNEQTFYNASKDVRDAVKIAGENSVRKVLTKQAMNRATVTMNNGEWIVSYTDSSKYNKYARQNEMLISGKVKKPADPSKYRIS